MILDSQLQLSAAQAPTSTGDTASTNVLDTKSAYDIGAGEDVLLFIRGVAAATSGGAATMQFVLQDSADNSSWADVQVLSPAIALASLTANKTHVRAKLPIGLRRYIRVAYRIGTAALTGGTFDAYMMLDAQAQQYGASGFTVS